MQASASQSFVSQGLKVESVPWRFTEKDRLEFANSKTVEFKCSAIPSDVRCIHGHVAFRISVSKAFCIVSIPKRQQSPLHDVIVAVNTCCTCQRCCAYQGQLQMSLSRCLYFCLSRSWRKEIVDQKAVNSVGEITSLVIEFCIAASVLV